MLPIGGRITATKKISTAQLFSEPLMKATPVLRLFVTSALKCTTQQINLGMTQFSEILGGQILNVALTGFGRHTRTRDWITLGVQEVGMALKKIMIQWHQSPSSQMPVVGILHIRIKR